MLRCIIEQRYILAVSLLNDFFQGLAFEAAILQKIIGRGDIGGVMLVMMVFESLLGQIGLERLVRIGKIGQGKRHLGTPRWDGGR